MLRVCGGRSVADKYVAWPGRAGRTGSYRRPPRRAGFLAANPPEKLPDGWSVGAAPGKPPGAGAAPKAGAPNPPAAGAGAPNPDEEGAPKGEAAGCEDGMPKPVEDGAAAGAPNAGCEAPKPPKDGVAAGA